MLTAVLVRAPADARIYAKTSPARKSGRPQELVAPDTPPKTSPIRLSPSSRAACRLTSAAATALRQSRARAGPASSRKSLRDQQTSTVMHLHLAAGAR